ncbi:DUF5060 domain-containing protein [Sunxiuqinia sp. A32]|uniref:DUF5060 domain-containing protein n=1 Tax=Sunxiuqinia sp. A32 TaxID=3461496 RepID=UPI004045DB42
MKKTGLIIFFLAVTAIIVKAQISDVQLITKKVLQYDRADFSIQLAANWTNPYFQEDVSLDMLLTAPNGQKLTLPCYYVSGESGSNSSWEARFTPQQAGKYEYQFLLSEKGDFKATSEKFNFDSKPSRLRGFLHTKSNWILQFDNGEPFRGVAENLCWESRTNDDSKFFKALHEKHEKYNYDYLIPLFSKNGGNFCRVWMCSWNFPIDRQNHFNNHRYEASNEYFNPSAVKKLDQFVDLCKDNNVYVMLCMGQGDVRADHNFFISDEAKAKYKNRLRYIVARWGYSPNIGMWEFFNEIDNIQHRNQGGPIPAKDIVAWHAEMSTYLKELDPYNHIRTTSISHRDLEGLNSVADLDINQKHIYNNTDVLPREIEKYEKEFGKPYVIGEFGYEWDWSKNFDDFSDGMDFDFKRGLWYGLFTSTPITPMSWWWEYFEDRDMMGYFRGVSEINNQMLQAGNGDFEKIDVDVEGLEAFGVKCGQKTFVYLLNKTDQKVYSKVKIEEKNQLSNLKVYHPTSLNYSKKKSVAYSDGATIIDNVELNAKDELVLILTNK